jgi:hypothetical protein
MKRIFFIVIMSCVGVAAGAQDIPVINRIHVNAGPKFGVNLSKMDGQSWQGGYKANLLGGLFLSVHGKRFGAQIEGLFSQTSYVTGPDFSSIYHTYINAGKDSLKNGRFQISYFNIPVMAQVRILGRAWMQVGAQYSGVVSVEDKDEFLKDAESLFSKGTVSAVGGLWIDVTKRINAGARYVMGMSNVNEEYSNVAETWKQRDVQLHLGITF